MCSSHKDMGAMILPRPRMLDGLWAVVTLARISTDPSLGKYSRRSRGDIFISQILDPFLR
jgi:hypothetical protein